MTFPLLRRVTFTNSYECRLDRQRLQQRIPGIEVIVNGDLRSEVIGEVIELPTAADGHENAGGALLDGRLDDRDRVEDRFDGTAQVEATGDGQPAFDAFLKEG